MSSAIRFWCWNAPDPDFDLVKKVVWVKNHLGLYAARRAVMNCPSETRLLQIYRKEMENSYFFPATELYLLSVLFLASIFTGVRCSDVQVLNHRLMLPLNADSC